MPTPDEETLRIEAAMVQVVAGEVLSTLEDVVRAILAAFDAAVSSSDPRLSDDAGKAFGRTLAASLTAMNLPSMDGRLKERAVDARKRGVARTVRTISNVDTRARAARTRPRVPKGLPRLDAGVKKGLREAAQLASQGVKTRADAAAIAAKVQSTRSRLEGSVRSTAHKALNGGVVDVAREIGQRLIWNPERHACLYCLALAGWVVEPDGLFPLLSFDPTAKPLEPVAYPPRHPRCRCDVKLTTEKAGRPSSNMSEVSRSAALAREARRTVLYQWSDYASNPALRRAAENLLKQGANLPSTVEKRARAALRKGDTVRRPT